MASEETAAPALVAAVREVEEHAHELGWDQPPRLFALVPTAELLEREPALGASLGVDAGTAAGTLTPVEQDGLPPDQQVEELLPTIMWPPEVTGCAVVLERLALPPAAEAEVPADPVEAQRFAETHPDRQEVRMAVGASRDGGRHCVLRVRTHEDALIQGADLVPSLERLVQQTLTD